MGLYTLSTTMTGAASDDFMFGAPIAGPHHSLAGAGGNDLIFGDSDWLITNAGATALAPTDLTTGLVPWSTAENPDIANAATVPHASVYREATGTQDWFSFDATANDQITLDIDYGSGSLGTSADLVVDIFDPANISVPLASNDDAAVVSGAGGSTSTLDPFLTFTAPTTGTFLIRVSLFGGGVIPTGSTYMLNVSHSGQAVTNADPVMGNDTIDGGDGTDTLYGIGGNDLIFGGTGNDVIDAGSGDDTVDGGAGADSLFGNVGIDTLNYGASGAGVTVSLSTNAASGGDAAGDTISGFENLVGSFFADTLAGDAGSNDLDGSGGGDTIGAAGGNDTVAGGGGADSLDGGAGTDTLSYVDSLAGVTVNLGSGGATGGDAAGDTFTGFENLTGSGQADFLTGDGGANLIDGGDGNDTLIGAGGADSLGGGLGDDTVAVATTSDPTGATFDGGAGTDTLLIARAPGTIDGVDLRNDALAGIETLSLDNSGGTTEILRVQVGAPQFQASGVSRIEFNTGATDASFVNIDTGTATVLDLSGVTVTGAGPVDSIGVFGDNDAETITGSSIADQLFGEGGDDTLRGGAGNDAIEGGAGADSIDGGAGTDSVSYALSPDGVTIGFFAPGSGGHAQGDTLAGIEQILGSGFADTLSGGGTGLTVDGKGGNDLIFDGAGASFLRGGAGGDTVFGSGGADSIDGGSAVDWVRYAASAGAITVNLAAGTGTGGDADGDTFTGIENVFGSNLADSVTGDDFGNTLDGFGGGDTLSAGAGNDVLLGGLGADSLDGGADLDTASYAGSNAGVNVGIFRVGTGGHSQGDTMTGIERLVGSGFSDTLVGAGTQATTFEGGLGNDLLYDFNQASLLIGGDQFDIIVAQGGNDTIQGGNGIDSLFPGAGADSVDGGAGVDTVSYDGSTTDLDINLVTNAGSSGDAAGDTYTGIENLIGGTGNDNFLGDAAFNILIGGSGTDTLNGGAGNDYLYGNVLGSGGDGVRDVYVFETGWGRDLVLDWEDGVDKIMLLAKDALGQPISFADFTEVDSPQGVRLDWFDGVSTLAIHLFGNNAGGTNLSPADIDATDFI